MFYTYGATGTSGVWAPLRPPCVATNAQALVDAACSQAPTQPAPGFIMPFSIPRVTTDVSPSHLLPTNDNGEPPLPVLACDPQRRSKAQQAMDEINKIYNQNPYILVN